MASFQSVLLMIASVILIIMLIYIALMLHYANSSQPWPPVIADCPDYWVDTSGNGGGCTNVQNLGTCTAGSNGKQNYAIDFTSPAFSGSKGMCAKYNWANSCQVSWDGITYGGNNPCAPPPPKTSG